MAWACAACETILIPSGPVGHHLFAILNDPCDFPTYPPASCVLAGFTSRHGGHHDRTCELAAGCHPFVTHESFVNYAQVRMERRDHIEMRVRQGLYRPHQALSPEL